MNIKEFWKAVLAQDEKKLGEYFHKDAYVDRHCADEHFAVEEYLIANCEYIPENGTEPSKGSKGQTIWSLRSHASVRGTEVYLSM